MAQGPELGTPDHWFFNTLELDLPAGRHTFVARVWTLGEKASYGQLSLSHGFFLCPADKSLLSVLATGLAAWDCKVLNGFDWRPPLACAWGTGWDQIIDGRSYDWGHEAGTGTAWTSVECGAFGDSADGVRLVSLQKTTSPHHRLVPGMLPAMMRTLCPAGRVRCVSAFFERPVGLTPYEAKSCLTEESQEWQALLEGSRSLLVPPFTKRRILVDLEDYTCAYPRLVVSGGEGSEIEIDWSEALYDHIDRPAEGIEIESCVWPKGNRDEFDGKYFVCPWFLQDGPGDTFRLDGGRLRSFQTLSWQAGRYVQILVETQSQPLTIDRLEFWETRYPLTPEGHFRCSDEALNALIPPMVRGLQMCAHETYMDCPFYEQLMYVGDTRLEALVTYVLTRDERLPRKALKLFDWSRLHSGLTQSRYPARVRQIIPPFSLWWIGMCHDYALWRGDPAFTKSLLPGVRAVCDHFAELINADGLLTAPNGWNFMDWVRDWHAGVPPDGEAGISGVLNWQAVLAFTMASDLELWFGEAELAELQQRRAKNLAQATHRVFWDEQRALYADDLAHREWSEHAQCLAILSHLVPSECQERLESAFLSATDLKASTIYFSHYLFETYRKLNRIAGFFEKLQLWHFLQSVGLKTPVETPEPTRSDCHAWGSHPLYHFYATLAGIRPCAPGFSAVEIRPLLGPLQWIDVQLPHPAGIISVQVTPTETRNDLPPGVRLVSDGKAAHSRKE